MRLFKDKTNSNNLTNFEKTLPYTLRRRNNLFKTNFANYDLKRMSKRRINKNYTIDYKLKQKWTKEEDDLIISYVNKYGKCWSKISLILKDRNNKRIRERFVNVLQPGIKKDKFTKDEDNKIIEMYQTFGPRWSKISKVIKNRSADRIKNRFNTLKKKFLNHLNKFEIINDNTEISDQHETCHKGTINNNSDIEDVNKSEEIYYIEKFLNLYEPNTEKAFIDNINNINNMLDLDNDNIYYSNK